MRAALGDTAACSHSLSGLTDSKVGPTIPYILIGVRTGQVQVVYTSSNGYSNSWGKLFPFYVNKLCQLQDKIEQHLTGLKG
jgi:hypothetical protein